MFSPEEQQIAICLLKSNLEEIQNDLTVQRSALPALDAENEIKYRETMAALGVVRSLNSKIECLKQDNVRLTAKRMQLKQQCETINQELERARRNRTELENSLKQEEHDTEQEIRSYEGLLRGIADRFRNAKVYNNEREIGDEMDSVNNMNIALEEEERRRQTAVNELRQELENMRAIVPPDLLNIVGKTELNEKITTMSLEYGALLEKRDTLLNNRNDLQGLPPPEY